MNLNSAYHRTNSLHPKVKAISSSPTVRLRKNDSKIKISAPEGRVVLLSKQNTFENQFLREVKSFILKDLGNPNFKITHLAKEMLCSQRKLERMVKKITGHSPVSYVRELRLREAFRLLKNGKYQTITEVRYAVGMEHPSYFKRKFKERFGVLPAELSV